MVSCSTLIYHSYFQNNFHEIARLIFNWWHFQPRLLDNEIMKNELQSNFLSTSDVQCHWNLNRIFNKILIDSWVWVSGSIACHPLKSDIKATPKLLSSRLVLGISKIPLGCYPIILLFQVKRMKIFFESKVWKFNNLSLLLSSQ